MLAPKKGGAEIAEVDNAGVDKYGGCYRDGHCSMTEEQRKRWTIN